MPTTLATPGFPTNPLPLAPLLVRAGEGRLLDLGDHRGRIIVSAAQSGGALPVVRNPGGDVRQLVSQEQVVVARPPHAGDYNLHTKEGLTRAAGVSATVHFSLEPAG